MVKVPDAGGQAGFNVPDNTYVLPAQAPATAVKVPQVGAVYVAALMTGAPTALKIAETEHVAPFPQTLVGIE
jgi:hypothetical protein